jgi:hypothetical protein
MAALAALLAVAGALVGALGAADDRPGSGGRPAGAALAVELDHDRGAQGGVPLVAAHPLIQLGRRSLAGGEGVRVEDHKYRIQRWGGRPAGALLADGDSPLADRFGIAGRHAEAVAGEGFAQRRPAGSQLLCSGVDAAESVGEGEGASGFG